MGKMRGMSWFFFVFLATGTAFGSLQIPIRVRDRMDQVVSVFENESLQIQYQYIEHLDDGRGYTAGRAGFTTATGDLLLVVERYVALNPQSNFISLLPTLRQRAKLHSPSIRGLKLLPQLWSEATQDKTFRQVQDGSIQ